VLDGIQSPQAHQRCHRPTGHWMNGRRFGANMTTDGRCVHRAVNWSLGLTESRPLHWLQQLLPDIVFESRCGGAGLTLYRRAPTRRASTRPTHHDTTPDIRVFSVIVLGKRYRPVLESWRQARRFLHPAGRNRRQDTDSIVKNFAGNWPAAVRRRSTLLAY
jgi:hypothetical protein